MFTDGRLVGATLDRNGLRPGRWLVTHDGWVAVSSEAGSFQVPDEQVARKGRLGPGSMFCVDLERGLVLEGGAAEQEVAELRPWGEWDGERTVHINDVPWDATPPEREPTEDELREAQLAFGYSQEDLRVVPGADGARREGADRLDGQRRRAGAVLGELAAACSPTSSSASPR